MFIFVDTFEVVTLLAKMRADLIFQVITATKGTIGSTRCIVEYLNVVIYFLIHIFRFL